MGALRCATPKNAPPLCKHRVVHSSFMYCSKRVKTGRKKKQENILGLTALRGRKAVDCFNFQCLLLESAADTEVKSRTHAPPQRSELLQGPEEPATCSEVSAGPVWDFSLYSISYSGSLCQLLLHPMSVIGCRIALRRRLKGGVF